MQLNELSPAAGAKKKAKRVGRGFTRGKTCGRGHKGQHSRSGGVVRPGFEGGQMPLYFRVPKMGFTSRIGRVSAEIRLSEINKLLERFPDLKVVNLAVLKAHNVVGVRTLQAKVFASGKIDRAVTLEGLGVSRGARVAIEAAGGQVSEATSEI